MANIKSGTEVNIRFINPHSGEFKNKLVASISINKHEVSSLPLDPSISLSDALAVIFTVAVFNFDDFTAKKEQ